MTEQPKRIRGMHYWDAKGMVFTELHEEHQLTPEGFHGISLQVGASTKYFYLDSRSLHDVEETFMELWLEIREIRKKNPTLNIVIKTFHDQHRD